MTQLSPTPIKNALQSAVPIESVRVQGWVRTRRDSKDFSFIELNDGSSLRNLQIIAKKDALPQLRRHPTAQHWCFDCCGGRAGPVAGQRTKMGARCARYRNCRWRRRKLSAPEKGAHAGIFARDRASASAVESFRLRVPCAQPARVRRSPVFSGSRFRLRSYTDHHRKRLRRRGRVIPRFNHRHQKSAAEKGGEIDYAQDFFARQTYLTVSGQLEAEAFACALTKVYTFGPTFRAENSNTSRHASEFWMIEPEMAFCDLTGNMDLAEELVKYLIADARKQCPEELELFAKFVDKELLARLDFVIERPFQRITYTEAVELLKKSGEKFEFPIDYGSNLQSEHERWLTEKHFKCPITVFNFPKEIKPFYMRSNDDGRTVAAIDLLVPGIGEIVGGSQREERLEMLEDNMRRHNMDPADYKWYLDLRRYGTVPHSGFGLGFERMLMFITGISNIRDVIPFARTPGSAEF